MNYKGYQLDAFQEQSIQAIDQKHSVLVAAPTGAGKTLIAEYAIERYLEEDRRIIYTAPVKALSNQKFRDFSAQYGQRIGILTGDVVINPYAPVLIMTTEIFRNTIFDDPKRLADVEYAIFDEIHYINDIERGTVWEESILFAPPHIDFICLSATVPNLEEFADWMREVRPASTIEVVCETHRPVPLEHHLYVRGRGEVDLPELKRLLEGAEPEPWRDSEDLIDRLAAADRLPCLYFCFSRRACEEKAADHMDRELLRPAQSREMLALFDELAQRFYVAQEPTAQDMRHLVAHGVAFHHAGMLPTLKEVVERLFTSGLLQLLFTTETFAVGVNMPACTVVFNSLEKYDGIQWRHLKTLEYHQMAGRAGRRGIDPVGYVYAQVELRFADVDEIGRIVSGAVEPVQSQFNLSYNSLLNLYQKYGLGLYQVCERSFNRFQSGSRRQEVAAALSQVEARGEQLPPIECIYHRPNYIREYARLGQRIEQAEQELRAQRREIRTTMNGRQAKRRRTRALRELDQPLRQLRKQRSRSKCHACPKKSQCFTRQQDLRRFAEERAHLLKENELLINYTRVQIERRLQFLQEFNYLDDQGLTVKGQVASEAHGFEIPLTEWLFARLLHQGRESEINALMVAICYEPKPSERFPRPRNQLRHFLRDAQQALAPLRRREGELGIDGLLPPLTFALVTAMEAWSEGSEFEELERFTNVSAGDLVRAFRHAIDLLRQLRRAVEGDWELQDKLSRCIRRINRDVVDAERQLRAGEAPVDPESSPTPTPTGDEAAPVEHPHATSLVSDPPPSSG